MDKKLNTAKRYSTKQGNIIADYLQEHVNEAVTAKSACADLMRMGHDIGLTTVYRHLNRMARDGILRVSNPPGEKETYFFLQKGEIPPIHLQCESCGRLVDIHCNTIRNLCLHLLDEHQFKVNTHKAILFGLCKTCRETKSDGERYAGYSKASSIKERI